MDKNEFINSIQLTINRFARVCNSDINMGDELIEKLKEEEVSENKEDVKIKNKIQSRI